MFALVEPATDKVDSTPVPESWEHYQLFTELKAYLDEHGYPQLTGHNIHSRAPVYAHGAPPTKSGINHSTYRFGVNRYINRLPVSNEALATVEAQQATLNQKVTTLNDQVTEQQALITQHQDAIANLEQGYSDIVLAGDMQRADQVDVDIAGHQRMIKRAGIIISSRQEALETLELFTWCMDCLVTGVRLRLYELQAKQAEEQLLHQLTDIKPYVDNYKLAAKQSPRNDPDDDVIGSLILNHLGLASG